MSLERKAPGIEQLNRGIGNIPTKRLAPSGMKNGLNLPQIAGSGGLDLRKYS